MEIVTIIIPIYNLEKVIERCIKSVIAQTYKKLQVLLIDDGSTDNSRRICELYMEKDSRLEVLYHDNKGVSYTRNRGIDCSKGKYIMFIDGDDVILPNLIEQYMLHAISTDADIVIGGITLLEKTGDTIIKCPTKGVFEARDFWSYVCENQEGTFGYVPNKLYRSSILKEHSVRFNEAMSVQEDLDFALSAYAVAQKFCCIEYRGYLYYHEQDKRNVPMVDILKNQIKMFELASVNQAKTEDVIQRIQHILYTALYYNLSIKDIRTLMSISEINKYLGTQYCKTREQKSIIKKFQQKRYIYIYIYFSLRRFIRSIIREKD